MTDVWTTHVVELQPDRVVKRFRHCHEQEHEREWRALTLLRSYAPDLAPAPLSLDAGGTPPTVVMTRLTGTMLRGGTVSPARAAALAAALSQLHHCLPPEVAAGLPVRTWHQRRCVDYLNRRYPELLARGLDPEVTRAAAEGMSWLSGTTSYWNREPELPPVLGQADGNLANFLWDGTRITIVDFEESGRSDIPYELSDLVEHVGSWVETEFDIGDFLGRFELTGAESARLTECRRLHALLWLVALSLVGPDDDRNPAGTPRRQAERLRARLETPSR